MADAKSAINKLNLVFVAVAILAVIGAAIFYKGITDESTGMFVCGLITTFFGVLFGFPLAWVYTSEKRKTLRMAVMVSKGPRTSLARLASSMGVDIEIARSKVVWCMEHEYLDGYVLDGDDVVLAATLDPSNIRHAITCPNCHASFVFSGDIGQCPYCGDFVDLNGSR